MALLALPSLAAAQSIPQEETFVCTPQQATGEFGYSHSGRWVDQSDALMDPFVISVGGQTLKFHSSRDEFPLSRQGTHLIADLSARHLGLADHEESFRLSWSADEQVGVFLLSSTRTSMSGIGFEALMGRCEVVEPS